MRDDTLERRLAAALHSEGDSLPFTITADELRRRHVARSRGRISRRPALLLAAALGLGLVGFGAVAGGWLTRNERQPSPIPSQVPSAPIAITVTPAPSILVLPATLPSLDAFLAPLDRSRIVRAQQVGPASAPTSWSIGVGGPGSTIFAPVTSSGSYRLYVACLGADVVLRSIRTDRTEPADAIPVICNADPTARDIGLGAGDAVAIETTAPTSWRFALVAPDRAAPHASAIASAADVKAAAGTRLDSDAASEQTTPDYTRPDVVESADVPSLFLTDRDSYRIALSCAGPGPLTFRLHSPPAGVTDPVEPPGAALVSTATLVECDGAIHVDTLRFPYPAGADVAIDAPAGTAWRIATAFEDPPIHGPADDKNWGLPIGVGPNLELTPSEDQWNGTFPETVRVRLVVTCYGGTSVDVTLREKETGDETIGSAPCATGRPTVTVIPVAQPGRSFDVTATTHGPMWLSVFIQQSLKG
ncbi:MAG TPA: hypothetical protein VFI34_08270 [Candidatus Limnocylindrales bacterium]|nr:hypothetical protein [Candidatus Limnocylindrales bacterium]